MNPFKIYTLYYGKRDATTADYFLDDTANIPIGMGYYFWVATNGEHTVLIDLGYDEAVGEQRGRTLVRHPAELLDKIQVDPKTVQHAIVTHLHWDHVETVRGTAVVASDAAKLYRNFMEDIPQPRSHSVADQIGGYALIKRLASADDLIIPGHDPEAMRRLPVYAEGIALLE
jgi:glyoxylase-like metal-dependent hydrolase (beta-lactamase superfamily II)